jgi:hypothetical protein
MCSELIEIPAKSEENQEVIKMPGSRWSLLE